jgi:NitT/TauT family transport system permease protein
MASRASISSAGRANGWLWQLASILGFGILWEVLSRAGLLNSLLFPPPSALFNELFHSRMLEFYKAPYAQEGTELLLINSVIASLLRVIAGITCGFVLAVGSGLWIAYSPTAERLLLPLMTMMAPISPVAWIPFAMVVFGIGNKPALFVVVVSVFFLITIATVASIRNVDPTYLLWAKQYGANRLQILKYVVVPSILPSLFVVLRVNFFAAWMSVLAAEMVGVSQGLGQMIMVGRSLFNMKLILIAMILIGVCGYILDRLLFVLQRRVLWWRQDAAIS